MNTHTYLWEHHIYVKGILIGGVLSSLMNKKTREKTKKMENPKHTFNGKNPRYPPTRKG